MTPQQNRTAYLRVLCDSTYNAEAAAVCGTIWRNNCATTLCDCNLKMSYCSRFDGYVSIFKFEDPETIIVCGLKDKRGFDIIVPELKSIMQTVSLMTP